MLVRQRPQGMLSALKEILGKSPRKPINVANVAKTCQNFSWEDEVFASCGGLMVVGGEVVWIYVLHVD